MIAQLLPLIDIHRVALHTILVKTHEEEHSEVDLDDDLLELTDQVKGMLKTRIIDAAGKHSKAFTLEIERGEEGTFYNYCRPIINQTDEEFLATSRQLALLLASKQTRSRIPGGYFLLLDCSDRAKNLGHYIVIKAEPDQGVTHSRTGRKSRADFLTKILFSSAQKLYKIGILSQRHEPLGDGQTPNELYECMLFDSQFSADKKPAEYFYRDFLSFSTDRNARLQTFKFNQLVENFIQSHIEDQENRENAMAALRVELKNQDNLIQPAEFGRRIFEGDDVRDQFTVEVTNELPPSIEKHTGLLVQRIQKRKISFSNGTLLTSPDDDFENEVHIIRSNEEIDLTDSRYTYIRVAGEPFKRKID
jgi:hypothetical protein